MNITWAGRQVDFCPWRPEVGKIFTSDYAFDCETTLIDDTHPWITPAYVLGAATDGQTGVFVTQDRVTKFFQVHSHVPVVMHYAPYDLEVLHTLMPQFDIYLFVEADLVWDTQLLHQLYVLGQEGHTARGKGQSKLARCAELYVGEHLPKDVMDAAGREVRASYGQWRGRRPQDIEPVYLEYLARDVMATFGVFERLQVLLRDLLASSDQAWGHVSPPWLDEQVRRWGPQTHHIQLRAAIVLRAITACGLGVDIERRNELVQELDAVVDGLRGALRSYGYVPGPGSSNALQKILSRMEQQLRVSFPRTPTGQIRTSRETLAEMAAVDSFIDQLLRYQENKELRNSFLTKMGRRRLHPSFNPLMVTGRTSSSGEINSQNLPKDDRVRSCFVPQDGYVFLDADYSTLEMATLAQAVQSQFGQPSRMAEAINAGQDLHTLVASRVTGKPEEDVTRDERQRAKPINFGKPGGMGDRGLQRYAKASYSVDLSDDEVTSLSNAWLQIFPEMEHFLRGTETLNVGENMARMFGLTPQSYFEQTGSRKFLNHRENFGRENRPHPILGWMCFKVLREPGPQTKSGRVYSTEEVDYFWTCVSAHLQSLPDDCHEAIRRREASPTLARKIKGLADRGSCFTLTGRLRANASFTARHNTCFQGLAADGAKIALWKLWRAGYRIVNFIHDEVLIEIPLNEDSSQHEETVRRLMIEGMQEVVPDVRISVECVISDRWCKEAQVAITAETS